MSGLFEGEGVAAPNASPTAPVLVDFIVSFGHGDSSDTSPLNRGPLLVLLEVDEDASTLGGDATVQISRLCADSYEVEDLVPEEQLLKLSTVGAGSTFALRAGDGSATVQLPALGTFAVAVQEALEALPLLDDVEVFAGTTDAGV